MSTPRAKIGLSDSTYSFLLLYHWGTGTYLAPVHLGDGNDDPGVLFAHMECNHLNEHSRTCSGLCTSV